MKLPYLSKTIHTIGLMAMLSMTIATSLQQPIQAQTIAQDKNGVCAPLPKGVFYQEFGGIKFSSAQKAAYRKIEAKIDKRYKVISDNTKEVDIPDGVVGFQLKPGVPNEKGDEIHAATMKMLNDGLSSAQQEKLLTQMYGKYAIILRNKTTPVYTPEQMATGRRIGRDFEAQAMVILTPQQQKIYKVNLALQRRIQACVVSEGGFVTPFDRIISPSPY
jgi:hypothetical protein